eukprot:COSAG01_NODE_72500_length_252_cov_25.562092_1_plen_60_part_10
MSGLIVVLMCWPLLRCLLHALLRQAQQHSAHGWACSARQSSEDCIYIMKVLRIKKKRESP